MHFPPLSSAMPSLSRGLARSSPFRRDDDEYRDSLGIELKGNVVVLDEAHNIIETINSVHSARVTSEQVYDAQRALTAYLDRYRQRLKGKNLVYVKQILHVLKQLHRFFNQHEQKSAASTEQPSSKASGSDNFSGSSSTRDNNSSSSANRSKNSTNSSKVQKKIFTINCLLFELGIDNLNLLKLERYVARMALHEPLDCNFALHTLFLSIHCGEPYI